MSRRLFYGVQVKWTVILSGHVQFYEYIHLTTYETPELSTYQGKVTTNSKQNTTQTTNTLVAIGPIETLYGDKFT